MIAVVTGAASGLGAAAARRLAASGCRVVAVDLPSAAERGGELVSELGGGDAALFAGADVSDEAQVAAALDACESRFGAPSVLVQCAGIGDARRTLSKKGPHSLAAFEKVMRVNTFGTFNVLRLTAERMAARDADADGMRGVCVNTASIAAYDGQIGQAAYGEQRRATRPLLASVSFVSLWFASFASLHVPCRWLASRTIHLHHLSHTTGRALRFCWSIRSIAAASKGAIVGMTLPIARDLASHGIRVCTIAPGLFKTPLLASLPEQVQNELGAAVPCPSRLGDPDEFGHLVQTIVENNMLNGEVIRIDGALRMPPK